MNRFLMAVVIGLTIAFIFRPQGLGVVFGMAEVYHDPQS